MTDPIQNDWRAPLLALPPEERDALEYLLQGRGLSLKGEHDPDAVRSALADLHRIIRPNRPNLLPPLFDSIRIMQRLAEKRAPLPERLQPEDIARLLGWEMLPEGRWIDNFRFQDKEGHLMEIGVVRSGHSSTSTWLTVTQLMVPPAETSRLDSARLREALSPIVERYSSLRGVELLFRGPGDSDLGRVIWSHEDGSLEELNRYEYEPRSAPSAAPLAVPLRQRSLSAKDYAQVLDWVLKPPGGKPSDDGKGAEFLDPVTGKTFLVRVMGQGRVELAFKQDVKNLFNEDERISPDDFKRYVLQNPRFAAMIEPGAVIHLHYTEGGLGTDTVRWIRCQDGFDQVGGVNRSGQEAKRTYERIAKTLLCFGFVPELLIGGYQIPLFRDQEGHLFPALFAPDNPGILIIQPSAHADGITDLYEKMRRAFLQSRGEGVVPPEGAEEIRVDMHTGAHFQPYFNLRRTVRGNSVDYDEPRLTAENAAALLGWRPSEEENSGRFSDAEGRVFTVLTNQKRLVKIVQIVAGQRDPQAVSRGDFENKIMPLLVGRFVNLERIIFSHHAPGLNKLLMSQHWRYDSDRGSAGGVRHFERVRVGNQVIAFMRLLGFKPVESTGLGEKDGSLIIDFNLFSDDEGRIVAAKRANGMLSIASLRGRPFGAIAAIERFLQHAEAGEAVEQALDRLDKIVYRMKSQNGSHFMFVLNVGYEDGRPVLTRQRLSPEVVADILGHWNRLPDDSPVVKDLRPLVAGKFFRLEDGTIYNLQVSEERNKPAVLRFIRVLRPLLEFGGEDDWLGNFETSVLPAILNRLPQVAQVTLEACDWSGSLWDTVVYAHHRGRFVPVFSNFDGSRIAQRYIELDPALRVLGFAPEGRPQMWVAPVFSDEEGRQAAVVSERGLLWLIQFAGPSIQPQALNHRYRTKGPEFLRQMREPLAGFERILWVTARPGGKKATVSFLVDKEIVGGNGTQLVVNPDSAGIEGKEVDLPESIWESGGGVIPFPDEKGKRSPVSGPRDGAPAQGPRPASREPSTPPRGGGGKKGKPRGGKPRGGEVNPPDDSGDPKASAAGRAGAADFTIHDRVVDIPTAAMQAHLAMRDASLNVYEDSLVPEPVADLSAIALAEEETDPAEIETDEPIDDGTGIVSSPASLSWRGMGSGIVGAMSRAPGANPVLRVLTTK